MQHNRYRNRRRLHHKKKRLWQLLQALFLMMFLLIVAIMVLHFTHSTMRKAEEISAVTQLDELIAEGKHLTQESERISEPPEIFAYAQELLQQNSDLVGMLGFENMALYVCQSEDNSYYASHRFDGSEDPAGMIYMDYRASIWPMSENVVLYGHNMRDGSRFGKLNRYENSNYLLENPSVRFASLYEIYEYNPIAVFYASVDPKHENYFDFAQINFADASDFDRYITEAKYRSIYPIPMTAEYGDRLLTLVTCNDAYERGRLVIVCKESS